MTIVLHCAVPACPPRAPDFEPVVSCASVPGLQGQQALAHLPARELGYLLKCQLSIHWGSFLALANPPYYPTTFLPLSLTK